VKFLPSPSLPLSARGLRIKPGPVPGGTDIFSFFPFFQSKTPPHSSNQTLGLRFGGVWLFSCGNFGNFGNLFPRFRVSAVSAVSAVSGEQVLQIAGSRTRRILPIFIKYYENQANFSTLIYDTGVFA
jgi:hypothetical protein